MDKQKEFASFMFQNIYGTLMDEDGKPFVEVYQYEIEELVKDMLRDLNTLVDVFGGVYEGDIVKVFALHFWDTDAIIDKDLDDIALQFDKLYGNWIVGELTNGK